MSLWRVCNILLQHLQNDCDGEEEQSGQVNASAEDPKIETWGQPSDLPVGHPADDLPVDDDDEIKDINIKIKGQERKAFRRSLAAHGLFIVVVGFDSAIFIEICLALNCFVFCADTLHLRVIRFIVRRSVLHVLHDSMQVPVPART
jgi:hypothetical protein